MRKFVLLLMTAIILTMASAAFAASYPSKNFECIAPAGPGGGWDTTMRMVAKVLTEQKLVTTAMPVVNKPGGGGGVALTYMQRKKGDPYELIVFSPPLILINLTGQSKLGYKDITPISMLINDFGAFAVPKNSKYKSLNEVFEAIKKDPKSVKIGGTSSLGSMDHVQFLVAAKAAGVTDLKGIQYIAFQGGEGLAAIMGAHIDLLSTGMAELVGPKESGDVKILALTSPKRIPSGPLADVPTLYEIGINAEYINWRGIFGAPGMPEAERKFMEDALKKMTETADWKEICERNGWTQVYLNAAEFKSFLDKSNEETKSLLAEIGMLQN
ncbi:tripartite tricarboxylate transporter substrate binding protein [Synergistaceae bacterium OttesenSCG-928-D05]|nr:tripartite tricarboxylate transporter substrate binding protein [Synergistaceae bacterium OttesenSCG-928-D05]